MPSVAGVAVPEQAATITLPPIGSSLAAFIAALQGHVVGGCGGFPTGQCTALACAWARNLGLGTPCGSCAAPDHCDGACWIGGGFAGWTWVPNGPSNVPVPGSLVAYRADCGADGIGSSGHVGIFVSGDVNSFTGFDQNWCSPSCACELHTHGYECVIGWHAPNAAGNPCDGVRCAPCSQCVHGTCESGCLPGETCLAGVCTAPTPPLLGPSTAPLVAAALLFGGLTALAVWEARRRPSVLRRFSGATDPSLGVHGGTDVAAGRAVRANPTTRAARRREPRGGVLSGETFGSGLARKRDLEATALATYGTTDELSKASFVFPDGALLAWPEGTNPLRTRESQKHHSDIAEALTGKSALKPLLADGWLRVQNFRDTLVTESGKPVTAAQAARLRDGAEPFERLVMQADYGASDRAHCEATPTTSRAVNDCVRSLNEQITEGTKRYAALLERIRRDHPQLLSAMRPPA